MRPHRLVPLLLPLFLAACGGDSGGGNTGGGAADAAPAAPTLDFSDFDAAVTQFVSDNALPGAAAVVVHRDFGIVHETGYGDFSKDRVFLIASSSKVMSVGVLMRLVDQGKVDLDHPVSEYLTAWGSFKTDITPAQLVSNSSGLVGLIDNPLYAPYICQYIDNGTLSDCAKTIYTADDAADRIPPDTEFHYGGGQWQLAGGIAEVVSGKKWADLVAETYDDACDVPSIGYTNQYAKALSAGGGSVAGALAYPPFFQADVANLPVTDNPSIEGGAYTNVHDYGKILLMHLRGGECDGGRVLSDASVKRMQEDRILAAYGGSTSGVATASPNGAMAGYGLGWWVDRDHPGVVSDAGAYGAMPFIDNARGYAAFLVLEADAGIGTKLQVATKPLLDAVFDAAKE